MDTAFCLVILVLQIVSEWTRGQKIPISVFRPPFCHSAFHLNETLKKKEREREEFSLEIKMIHVEVPGLNTSIFQLFIQASFYC